MYSYSNVYSCNAASVNHQGQGISVVYVVTGVLHAFVHFHVASWAKGGVSRTETRCKRMGRIWNEIGAGQKGCVEEGITMQLKMAMENRTSIWGGPSKVGEVEAGWGMGRKDCHPHSGAPLTEFGPRSRNYALRP